MTATVTKRMMPLFDSSLVQTATTSTGKKFCQIKTGNETCQAKPITFLLSNEQNLVEDFILRHTLYELSQRFGALPETNILCGDSDLEECFNDIRSTPNKQGAVVSLSSYMSSNAYRYLTMDGFKVPVLFANVSTSQQYRLSRHRLVNGVSTQVQNYQRQLLTIKDLMPQLRRLLIPHDLLRGDIRNDNLLSGNIQALIAECDRQNIETVLMGVVSENRVPFDICQYRSTDTMFMLTRENSVVSQMDAIIKTCNGHRMPIFSDLPLPTLHGAAFGTGTSGIELAAPLADMIYEVIMHERAPSALNGVVVPESSLLLYNNLNFRQQGIKISEEQTRLLEAQHIMMYAQNQQML